MNCFKRLVDSNFLANAKNELVAAQRVLKAAEALPFDATLIFNRDDAKYVYDCYVEDYALLFEVEQSTTEISKDVIYYIQEEHVLFIYSRSKKMVDEAVLYSYSVNGDVPLFRAKHIINKHAIHTALIDIRIPFPASSPN
jgi:hypothetical protein